MPKLIFKNANVKIYAIAESYGTEYYVYSGVTLLRVCPSIGMAHEVAAGA